MNARRCMWAPGDDALQYMSLALYGRQRVRNATKSLQELIRPDVADGSNSEVGARNREVCFAPVTGHRQAKPAGPFCAANSRHGGALNRGSLNSAAIHGTHVPVEEPSPASIADITRCLRA